MSHSGSRWKLIESPSETRTITHGILISSEGSVIQCDDSELLKRISAFLNGEAVSYVLGEPEKLREVTRQSLDDDPEDLVFLDRLRDARKLKQDNQEIWGMYLAPIAPR